MSRYLSVGVDEAGRGPVLGPLVVAIVAATEEDRAWFELNNVRDSKIVPLKERTRLAEEIRARCWWRIRVTDPHDIDEAVRDKSRTLNGLELECMASLLNEYRREHVDVPSRGLVDAPSRNTKDILNRLQAMCGWNDPHILDAQNHADATSRTVGAASLIAKDERERLMELLRQNVGEDLGSGYPSDPKTIAFMKKCPRDSKYVRWTWKTAMA